jgi:glycosyltransferase involved in cell wall biosynthesis
MVDKTHIVIPVRDQLHLTQKILTQLKYEKGWDKCWVFNNGSTDGTWDYLIELQEYDDRFWPVMATGDGIYDMWDSGFTLAKHEGADSVGIFNNDITIFPNTIQKLKDALDSPEVGISYPDYNATSLSDVYYRETSGTYRHGGMSGFCFMLKSDKVDWTPLVDPVFKWYGGDDDIAFEMEKRGAKQIRVMGLPIEHLHEGTARHHSLGAQKAADMESIFRKWGK